MLSLCPYITYEARNGAHVRWNTSSSGVCVFLVIDLWYHNHEQQLASVGARMSRFVGDNQGWIYSDKELQGLDRDDTHYWSADFNLQVPCPVRRTPLLLCSFLIFTDNFHVSLWNPCPVRVLFHAYDRWPNSCRSTCLGPGKFSVQNLNTPEFVSSCFLKATADFQVIRRVFILNLKGVADIRASHMQGGEAVLGLLPIQWPEIMY